MTILFRSSSHFVLIILIMAFGSPAKSSEDLNLATMTQTRSRPLFSVTRRPKEPPPPAIRPFAQREAPPPPIEPPSVTLIGVAIGPEEREVIVHKSGAPKAIRVVLGEEIDGWRVTSIEYRAIILQQGNHSTTLSFPSASNKSNAKESENQKDEP